MLPSDRIQECFDHRIREHDVVGEDRRGYGIGFTDGEKSGLSTGSIIGNRRGFYHGLAWIIPTAIVSLSLGYIFGKMSSVPPASSYLYEHRDTTSSELETFPASSLDCVSHGSSDRCCDTTQK